MTEEIWKDVVGYEGLYQVSNLGRVKSLNYNNTGKEQVLKQRLRKDGYYDIVLHKNGYIKGFTIHRLVYMTFKGPIPEGLQVNHIDEDKSNNTPENLNLMTRRENNNWGYGNKLRSETQINKVSQSKPVLQYDKSGNFIAEYPSIHEAERQTKIAKQNISSCCKGKLKYAGGFIWKYKN